MFNCYVLLGSFVLAHQSYCTYHSSMSAALHFGSVVSIDSFFFSLAFRARASKRLLIYYNCWLLIVGDQLWQRSMVSSRVVLIKLQWEANWMWRSMRLPHSCWCRTLAVMAHGNKVWRFLEEFRAWDTLSAAFNKRILNAWRWAWSEQIWIRQCVWVSHWDSDFPNHFLFFPSSPGWWCYGYRIANPSRLFDSSIIFRVIYRRIEPDQNLKRMTRTAIRKNWFKCHDSNKFLVFRVIVCDLPVAVHRRSLACKLVCLFMAFVFVLFSARMPIINNIDLLIYIFKYAEGHPKFEYICGTNLPYSRCAVVRGAISDICIILPIYRLLMCWIGIYHFLHG